MRRLLLGLAILVSGCNGADGTGASEDEATKSNALSWNAQTDATRKDAVFGDLRADSAWRPAEARRLRYEKMRESPLSFYRATFHLFHRDMRAKGFLERSSFYRKDAITWALGDAHVANVGAFEDDRGEVVFDLNDFDEAWVTSPLHDVWRMSASIALLARSNGIKDAEHDVLAAFAKSYSDRVLALRDANVPRNERLTARNVYGELDEFLAEVESRPPTEARVKMLDKWAPKVDGKRRFAIDGQKLAAVSDSERATLTDAMKSRYPLTVAGSLQGRSDLFEVLDIARRLDAGTGSLGTDRFYILIRGKSADTSDDRILDVKAQRAPALVDVVPEREAPRIDEKQGCRAIAAQRAMLANANDYLGCVEVFGQSFSVRERSPYKEEFPLDKLTTADRLKKLAEQWGWVLANAHVRSDDEHDRVRVTSSFEKAFADLASSDRKREIFVREVTDVGLGYADQVEHDYAVFKASADP